ncbi:MAG: type II toxin-antitoxin system HicA family toxin [Chloroflexi bacterium]|nr:type II toxin-antitoxin system HicA family toxin [Chloroflexota bacterium]
MTKLPPLKARQVIRGLERLGFELVRQKGSHAMFHHEDCRRAPLPIHPTADISPYFLSDVLKQLEITEDQFLRAIRRR